MNILLEDVYACLFLIDRDPFVYNLIIRLSKKCTNWLLESRRLNLFNI